MQSRTPRRPKLPGYSSERPQGVEGRYVWVQKGQLPGFPGRRGAHQQFGERWHRIYGSRYEEVTDPKLTTALDNYTPPQPKCPVKSSTKPPGAVEVDYIRFPGHEFGFRGRTGVYTKIEGTWYWTRYSNYLPVTNNPQLVEKLEEFARGQKK